MDVLEIFLCLIAGFAAGVVNTLAGSGSLFTLPVLLFMGLPAPIANGTNRVGIFAQTGVGALTLLRKADRTIRKDYWMIVPAIAGSLYGAMIAVEMNEQVLRTVIGVVMLVLLVMTLFRFESLLREHSDTNFKPSRVLVSLLLFGIGLYGGFIQAGVGILLLSLMLLYMRFSLVHANALKNLINFCLTVPAFLVFIWHGHVRWEIGVVIAMGQAAGAWVAATYAAGNQSAIKLTRWLLIIMMCVSSWELLGLHEIIF